MKEIEQLHNLFLLKHVDRACSVKGRKESTAEHIYSCLILAEHFMPQVAQRLDETRVMKILLFHDIVEIEAGDTFILDDKRRETKKDRENKALEILKKKIPESLAKDCTHLWKEYEDNKTPEARFCHAINSLDPMIQSIFEKSDWKNHRFIEEELREKKEKYFEDFPALKKFFEKLMKHGKKMGYFA